MRNTFEISSIRADAPSLSKRTPPLMRPNSSSSQGPCLCFAQVRPASPYLAPRSAYSDTVHCATEEDFSFTVDNRRKAIDVLVEHKKDYTMLLFGGIAHGFATRADPTVPKQREYSSAFRFYGSLGSRRADRRLGWQGGRRSRRRGRCWSGSTTMPNARREVLSRSWCHRNAQWFF